MTNFGQICPIMAISTQEWNGMKYEYLDDVLYLSKKKKL
jgi:hypothetical protein